MPILFTQHYIKLERAYNKKNFCNRLLSQLTKSNNRITRAITKAMLTINNNLSIYGNCPYWHFSFNLLLPHEKSTFSFVYLTRLSFTHSFNLFRVRFYDYNIEMVFIKTKTAFLFVLQELSFFQKRCYLFCTCIALTLGYIQLMFAFLVLYKRHSLCFCIFNVNTKLFEYL